MEDKKPTIWNELLKRLTPEEEFGALEVGEKNIRYVLFSKYDLKPKLFGEVQMELGTVVKGELKNKPSFIKALNEIKKFARCDVSLGKCSPIVIALSSANFFFNIIELPDVPEASYDEAVRLNAANVAPLSLESSYFDWQNLGVNLKTLQREFLVGMSPRQKIDSFLDCFNQAGFQPLALESRSLSLLRNFNYFSQTIEKNILLLLIEIGEDGISLLLGRQGKLYFDFYIFWDEIPEAADQKITKEDLEVILSREVKRIIEYSAGHNQETITHFCIFSPIMKKDLAEFIAKQFNLRHVDLNLPVLNSDKSTDIYAGLVGAGLRGSLIPRNLDDIISLLPEGTEKIYANSQVISFISLWSKILVVGFLGVVGILSIVFFIANVQKNNLLEQLNSFANLPEAVEIIKLEDDVKVFNRAVSQVEILEKSSKKWSLILEPIINEAKARKILITRISLSESNNQIRLRARAQKQPDVLEFQEALKKSFFSVDVPLSSFSQTPQGIEFDASILIEQI